MRPITAADWGSSRLIEAIAHTTSTTRTLSERERLLPKGTVDRKVCTDEMCRQWCRHLPCDPDLVVRPDSRCASRVRQRRTAAQLGLSLHQVRQEVERIQTLYEYQR